MRYTAEKLLPRRSQSINKVPAALPVADAVVMVTHERWRRGL